MLLLFLNRIIILPIELPWPENLKKQLCVIYGTTGQMFRRYQVSLDQRPRNAEPKPYHWSTSNSSDAKLVVWLVNLAPFVCDVDRWLNGRFSSLSSVVTGSISSGGDHSIYYWWYLIMSKLYSRGSICFVQVFYGFSGNGNSFYHRMYVSILFLQYARIWIDWHLYILLYKSTLCFWLMNKELIFRVKSLSFPNILYVYKNIFCASWETWTDMVFIMTPCQTLHHRRIIQYRHLT